MTPLSVPRLTAVLFAATASLLSAQPFLLPTANRALFEPGGAEKFFVGTVGKPWTSGAFGCVRTEGTQLHEGLDIRCLQRDKQGEPADPVMATADGVVAYINSKPSLSNYGRYIVLRHQIDGVEICSLYGHLREVRTGLGVGQSVKAGEAIAVMGRSTNTREGISKERAHVHFELALLINDTFPVWYKKTFPGQRNDHRQWNGQNLAGLDPQAVLLEQRRLGSKFNLLRFIQGQTALCRVLVRDTDFPWLKRHRALIRQNPIAARDGVAGYEIALNFNAVPFELIPRAAPEIKGKSKLQVLSVNAAEQEQNPCRKLVRRSGSHWELTESGLNALGLLTH